MFKVSRAQTDRGKAEAFVALPAFVISMGLYIWFIAWWRNWAGSAGGFGLWQMGFLLIALPGIMLPVGVVCAIVYHGVRPRGQFVDGNTDQEAEPAPAADAAPPGASTSPPSAQHS